MRKEFEFTIQGHDIKVVNSWARGIKLYVDGDFRDHDFSFFPNGKIAPLSAKLGDLGILEVFPICALISVEIDAYLISGKDKRHVFSSHKRLSLREQRLAK